MIPALSLRQPWLWAVTDMGKTIENRRWNTHHRGPFWLHAAKGCTRDECLDALEWMRDVGILEETNSMTADDAWTRLPSKWPGYGNLERGGVCGYAELVDVIEPLHMWGPRLVRAKVNKRQADRTAFLVNVEMLGGGPVALPKDVTITYLSTEPSPQKKPTSIDFDAIVRKDIEAAQRDLVLSLCGPDGLEAFQKVRPPDLSYVLDACQMLGLAITKDDLRWWMPDQYGFVLRGVRKFPRLDCRGMLNFFQVPEEIHEVASRAIMGVCPCRSDLDGIGPGHLEKCRNVDPAFVD